jgi:hypothetical protein
MRHGTPDYECGGGPLDGERHRPPTGATTLPVPLRKQDRERGPPRVGSDPRLPWGPAVPTGYYRLRRVHLLGVPRLALVWMGDAAEVADRARSRVPRSV